MLLFYGHPFSSYTWKALIALYEKDIAFDYRIVEPDRPQHMEELRAYWPIGKFPLIVDEGVPWFEATIIIAYIARKAPEPGQIGRAHVRTPVTNAHIVYSLLLE